MSSLVSGLLRFAGRTIQQKAILFQSITPLPSVTTDFLPSISNPCSIGFVRTKIRNNFPVPKEQKRVKCLGWRARLSTKNGRRLLMRRILKGRWYYSH